MTEPNPSPNRSRLSQGTKYTLLFASWVFLSAISFYLGMNLMQKEGKALVLKDKAPKGNVESGSLESEAPRKESKTASEEESSSSETPAESSEILTPPEFVADETVSFRASAWSTDGRQ